MNSYPEHDKLKLVQAKTQFVHDFLEYLEEIGISLYHDEAEPVPVTTGLRDRYLYSFIDVDPEKIEAEKEAMLDEIRKANEGPVGQAHH